MAASDEQHPVLIWALTIRGEIMAVHCADRAEALEIGRANVASGAWRTWDAFETAAGAAAAEARRIASSEEESSTTPTTRPRILADWAPPQPPPSALPPSAPPLLRAPTVKESLKAYRDRAAKPATSHEKEKPKATRRRRIIPD